jgi:GDPmannose 4,6-dehydratase
MLQQDKPDDYVIATGVSYSVKEFAKLAFGVVGLNWEDYVTVDERYLRPAEIPDLRGDASKARSKLGWTPHTSFDELVRMMVDADVEKYRRST